MTTGKPDDIPQDVWDKAEDTLDTMLSNHGYEGWRADSIATIGHAILAAEKRGEDREREACAYHLEMRARAVPKGHESSTYNWLMHCAGLLRKREG